MKSRAGEDDATGHLLTHVDAKRGRPSAFFLHRRHMAYRCGLRGGLSRLAAGEGRRKVRNIEEPYYFDKHDQLFWDNS